MVLEGTQLLELLLDPPPALDGQLRNLCKLVAGHFTMGINELDQA